jgi:hypothetical protein
VEAFVRVFGKSKACEKPCWLLAGRCLWLCIARLLRVPGALAAQIELAISAVDEWKLARQPFAEKEPRNFAWFVRQGKRHPRDTKTGRGGSSFHTL